MAVFLTVENGKYRYISTTGEDIQKMKDDIYGVVVELGEHKVDYTNPHNVTSEQVNVIDSLPPSALSQEYPRGISTFYMGSSDVNQQPWIDEVNSVLGTNYNASAVRLYVTTNRNKDFLHGGHQEVVVLSNYLSSMSDIFHKLERGQGSSAEAEQWSGWRVSLDRNDMGYVTGIYTGDGNAEQFIELGFTPSAVQVMQNQDNTSSSAATVFHRFALATEGYPYKSNTSNSVTLEIIDGGFKVYNNNWSLLNSPAENVNPLRFIAFK